MELGERVIMNREILFKAKRKDNGEWVEGNLITNERNENQKYIGYIFDERNGVIEDFDLVEVIPETLCQYTGLTDKNIWENDIVRNEKGDIGVVQWFEEHAAFMIWNKTKNCVCYLAENDFSKIEVIGNIFDNADLLEVK